MENSGEKKTGLDALFEQGSVIDLTVSTWAARARLTAEDLGFEPTSEVKKALSLGCHRLAPSEAFVEVNKAITDAEDAIWKCSVPFPLIRGARFVPNKKQDELATQLTSAQRRFTAAVEAFGIGYEEMQLKHRPVMETAMAEAAKTPEAAKEAVKRLAGIYPSTLEVKKRFRMTWTAYNLTAPKSSVLSEGADEVQSIAASFVEGLRTEVKEKLVTLIKLAQDAGDTGKLNQRSLNSAIEVLDRVAEMNEFIGDSVLGRSVELLKKLLTMGKESNPLTLARELDEVGKAIEVSTENAIAEAEAKLTGKGRRQFDFAATPDPTPEPVAEPVKEEPEKAVAVSDSSGSEGSEGFNGWAC